ncbi:MAG: transcriptional regulator [Halobacteriota archaeon]
MPTTRERIVDVLRGREATPSEIAEEVDASVEQVHRDLEHVAASLEGSDERLLVAPPECRECGFGDFDDKIAPSKCPDCKSERLLESVFTVVED